MGGYRGGFGGNNMQALLKQAQQMQQQVTKAQQELEEAVLTGSSGGGMVEVELIGKKVMQAVHIRPEAADDVEMLEDLLLAAYNDALRQAEALESEKLGPLTGGLGGLL